MIMILLHIFRICNYCSISSPIIILTIYCCFNDVVSVCRTNAFQPTICSNSIVSRSLRNRNVERRFLTPIKWGLSRKEFNSVPRIIETSEILFLSSKLVCKGTRTDDNNDLDTIDTSNDNGIGIGIDLGTTNSAVAYYDEVTNTPKIIPIPNNGNTIPSIVALVAQSLNSNKNNDDTTTKPNLITDDGFDVLLGNEAIEYEINVRLRRENEGTQKEKQQHGSSVPLNIYRHVKRIIGTGGKLAKDIREIVPNIIASTEGKTYKKSNMANILYDADNHPTLLQRYDNTTTSTTIRPEVISSYIIQYLVQTAEQYTGRKVNRAVIGVPAYFHDGQRQATINACHRIGLRKVKLLREPEAAALAYGSMSDNNNNVPDPYEEYADDLVLVFDLGGGTYDVSMLLMGGGVTEILSTSGNTNLGGSDWDTKIGTFLLTTIKKQQADTSTSWSESIRQKIVQSAERIRIYLSNNVRVNLALPLTPEGWSNLVNCKDVILPKNYNISHNDDDDTKIEGNSIINGTHVILTWSRRDMEKLCSEEFLELVRPIREVAITAGALLPGDTSPALVEAAMMDLQNDDDDDYDFYRDSNFDMKDGASDDYGGISDDVMNDLLQAEMRNAKKAQQSGRRRARTTAKEEKKFREEKRKVEESFNKKQMQQRNSADSGNQKSSNLIRDGITGRPISRIVLVGGATRMPAIGRLLKVLTGLEPKRTVNPDEAVALGCAVHIANLDGKRASAGQGVVLNPMQAAIVRAMTLQQKQQQKPR